MKERKQQHLVLDGGNVNASCPLTREPRWARIRALTNGTQSLPIHESVELPSIFAAQSAVYCPHAMMTLVQNGELVHAFDHSQAGMCTTCGRPPGAHPIEAPPPPDPALQGCTSVAPADILLDITMPVAADDAAAAANGAAAAPRPAAVKVRTATLPTILMLS
jgi:hypothetical protein